MSTRSLDGVKLGARTYARRVGAALGLAGASSAGETARWLNAGRDGGRALRARLAHGDDVDEARVSTALPRLRAVIRSVPPLFMTFSIRWHEDGAELAEALGIDAGASPVAAFNGALLEHARGNVDLAERGLVRPP